MMGLFWFARSGPRVPLGQPLTHPAPTPQSPGLWEHSLKLLKYRLVSAGTGDSTH